MKDNRVFRNTTQPTLKKLYEGLDAVVNEAPPDHGALSCALLLGMVRHELSERAKDEETRMDTARK